jgi:hypothetical protein
MSDTLAILSVVWAGVLGAVLVGIPWIRWSQRRKARRHEDHILVRVEWLGRLSDEQRVEHLQHRTRRQKRERRERIVVH